MPPLFASVLVYLIIIAGVSAVFLLVHKEKYAFLKKIHREQKVGSLMCALALGWAGWQGYTLLGQDFPGIAGAIPILVPALIVGVYVLMDYIFTRALGGLLIMLICELLFQLQAVDMQARFIFSSIAYVFAVMGMYMIGQPWRFRNLLFKSAEEADYGKKLAASIVALTAVMFIPVVMAYV